MAIIDLTTGNQPASNSDGGIQAVVNGEICNYRELWKELPAKGQRLRSGPSGPVLSSTVRA